MNNHPIVESIEKAISEFVENQAIPACQKLIDQAQEQTSLDVEFIDSMGRTFFVFEGDTYYTVHLDDSGDEVDEDDASIVFGLSDEIIGAALGHSQNHHIRAYVYKHFPKLVELANIVCTVNDVLRYDIGSLKPITQPKPSSTA